MPEQREILTVAELNRRTRSLVEAEFTQVWVEGEISNFVQPRSGHWYFTLKDETAQVRCAMFVNRNRLLRIKPQDGMHVILRGKASLYEGRGEFQLIAENLVDAGAGRLQQRFEELKRKLHTEGLFDDTHKKPLPTLPHHLGIITSSTGAALQDILTVLRRRFPAIPVTLIPSAVQGEDAVSEIVAAISRAHNLPDGTAPIEVLILGRGGGSLEDLWAFNEEAVARAIFASSIPIVSAVGHEVDYSIADFVADARAPTPSAAAEMLSPDREDMLRNFRNYEQYLGESSRRIISRNRQDLQSLQKRLRHPGKAIQDRMQHLDDLETRFSSAIHNYLAVKSAQLAHTVAEMHRYQPTAIISEMKLKNRDLGRRLLLSMRHGLDKQNAQLSSFSQLLQSLSPLQTLGRGYTITRGSLGGLVSKIDQVEVGESIVTQVSDGQIHSKVESVSDNKTS